MLKHKIASQTLSDFRLKKAFGMLLENAPEWFDPSQNYYSEDFFLSLCSAALERSSVEDIYHSHKYRLLEPPSSDTVFTNLEGQYSEKKIEDLEKELSSKLQKAVKKLGFLKRRNTTFVLAIDTHKEAYYGEPIIVEGKEYTILSSGMGNRGKTLKTLTYATLCIVSEGKKIKKPITIGIVMVYLGMRRKEIVERLLEQIKPLNLRIERLLMDGKFATPSVYKPLDERKIP